MNDTSARLRWSAAGVLAGTSLFLAAPLIAERGPTSLLPPGFGDNAPSEEPVEEPQQAASGSSAPSGQQTRPGLDLDLSDIGGPATASGATALTDAELDPELTDEELEEQRIKYDLPARSARSLDRIGPLTPATGGLSADAFGTSKGKFLATLMREAKAPFASRWASILLRRTLLSATDTPKDIEGADWAAERAWLLLRMGEADAARMMVQSVDSNKYSKRLYAVGMQSYLASADPVGLCPIYQGAKRKSESPSWQMADAICASFAAEQGRASAILNRAERSRKMRGIDYRLTEKIVGAGAESRRSVTIEWDGVDTLTAWRFGLATAANVDIPPALMNAAGRHVWAWQARAPMVAPEKRIMAVETAARLGVYSSAALVDFYAQLYRSEDTPDDFHDRAEALRLAYAAPTIGGRIEAMRDIWTAGKARDLVALLAISRAAAALPVADTDGETVSQLIAAMMSAGYDNSAVRWARASGALDESDGRQGWALLAVAAPRPVIEIGREQVQAYVSDNALRGKMALAGLAAMGRVNAADIEDILAEASLSLAPTTRWEKAITNAAQREERGTVALLVAIGMQVSDWSHMPPEHLYHIVLSLRRVGLEPEARMIAAEAIIRS